MRLTLLLICLFSILGGCAASSSHGVVVPKLIRYSEKHPSSSSGVSNSSSQLVLINADALRYDSSSDDIDDDDENYYLPLKKFKDLSNAAFAFAQLATLSRLHGSSSTVTATVRYNSSRIYIAHRTLRV